MPSSLADDLLKPSKKLLPEYVLASFRVDAAVIIEGPAVVVIDCAWTSATLATRASTVPILLEFGDMAEDGAVY
jgi:hypothetical protein